jgi:hypothetical protein
VKLHHHHDSLDGKPASPRLVAQRSRASRGRPVDTTSTVSILQPRPLDGMPPPPAGCRTSGAAPRLRPAVQLRPQLLARPQEASAATCSPWPLHAVGVGTKGKGSDSGDGSERSSYVDRLDHQGYGKVQRDRDVLWRPTFSKWRNTARDLSRFEGDGEWYAHCDSRGISRDRRTV